MSVNSEAIHATLPTPFRSDPAYASVTQRPGKVYMHLHSVPKSFQLRGLQSAVKNARLLSEKSADLPLKQEVDSVTGLRSISVDIPDSSRSGLLPVLALEIDGLAKVSSEIVQQPDGTVLLPASAAEIRSSGVIGCGERRLEDRTTDAQSSAVRVSSVGAVVNWLSPDTSLAWDFVMMRSGNYQVRIVSTGLHHSNPWAGGHKIRVQIGDSVLAGTMQLDETVDDVSARYYTQAASILGDVSINHAGLQRLTLYADEIQSNDGVGLAVMSVVLIACD